MVGIRRYRDERQLHQLFVDPEFQNRGIGKALLDCAKQKMPTGFWLRTMVRNRAARRFYERESLLHRQDGPQNFPDALFSTYEWTPAAGVS
jgi:ribosomal protein S18 acetylase RimI-like enzyme